MSKIFFVLGKSCSGKDTIFQSLKENKQLNLKTVVGYTTRPMRVNEKDGVEYFFVDQNKLEELKKAKKARAVNRERNQSEPKYKELCRRFLADEEDFSEEKIEKAGIKKRFENNNLNQCIKEIEQEIVKKNKVRIK